MGAGRWITVLSGSQATVFIFIAIYSHKVAVRPVKLWQNDMWVYL